MTAFSAIIPVYNRKELIRDALESVLSQTFLPHDIIVADDGSDDGTPDLVREYLSEKAGSLSWKLLEGPHCGLAGAVRNRAVAASEGNWVAFLDSDDLWMPEKLALQRDYLESHPDIRLVHTRETWLRGEKIISQKKQRHKREGDVFEDALVKCMIGPSTVALKRELWEESGGFREDLEIAEDYELWLRITAGEPVGYLDRPLITKRAGAWEQLSLKYGQIEKFRLRGLGDLVERGWFRGRGIPPEREALAVGEFARKCHIYALGCEKRGRRDEAALWHRKRDLYGKA
jgi:glycosyltransferase involved in cell wall biosynthesis